VNAVLVDAQAEAFIVDNDCYMLSDTTATFLPEGGIGTVWLTVADDPSCVPWTAVSHEDWITDVNPAGGGTFPDSVEISFTVAENTLEDPRTGTLTIAGLTFTVEQEGTACSFSITPTGASFESWGGTGTVEITADPDSCIWEAASNDPWITGLTLDPANGEGSGTVEYTVEVNPGVARAGTMTIALRTFTVDQDGIYFDDFDDDVMAPDWDYQSIELWEEANDSLRAQALYSGQTATARASWAFDGCIECTITTRMRVNIFAFGTATLYGWHRDEDTYVALTMDEFTNEWSLTQVVGGAVVQSQTSGFFTIEVGEIYDVEISFDGADFIVLVDDVQIISMPKAPGSEPDGTVGFSVTETDADFDEISASTVTRSGIFWHGFDHGDTSGWSSTGP
jgi:hypothetical protein